MTQRFMECSTRDEFKKLQEEFKPVKKACQELVGLCNATAKDLKGAVKAAQKRKEQEAAMKGGKKRKVAANPQAAAGDKGGIFEFIAEGDGVVRIPVGKISNEAGANNFKQPFMLNIPQDFEGWQALLVETKKIVDDFRLEFDSSTLRASIGRAQKPFDKMSADANLHQKIESALFDKVFPRPMRCDISTLNDDLKASLALQRYGIAKNTWTCVPEKGHFPTSSLTLTGSAMMVLVPIPPALDFFAEEPGNPKIPLAEVAQKLKAISNESFFAKLVQKLGPDAKITYGTVGSHDLLYIPPGWLSIVSVAKEDALGLKLRVAIADLVETLKAVQAKLLEQSSSSPALDSFVAALTPEASS